MFSILLDKIRIRLELPDELIAEPFYAFEESKAESHKDIRGTISVRLAGPEVLEDPLNEQPKRYETDFASAEIYEDRICCRFKEESGWIGLAVLNDTVFCIPDEKMQPGPEEAAAIFDYMKGGIFLLLGKYGYYVLHSSSLIVNGRVIAFAAESGVGKTTHTQFWEKRYHVPVFNGDMLMIDAFSDAANAIGIPWSGSTGITNKDSMPLAGIFFLERGRENKVREINELEKLILFTERMLSVNFDHTVFLENAGKLQKTARQINCAKLICRPDEEAAETAYSYAAEHKWITEERNA